MIVKFMLASPEKFTSIGEGIEMQGRCVAVVSALDVEAAKSFLREKCDRLGVPFWGDAAQITIFDPPTDGVIAYAEV